MDIIHIISISHGGTGKYLTELQQLFPDYNHILLNWNNVLDEVAARSCKPCLVHIQTIWGNDRGNDHFMNVMNFFKGLGVPIHITVHDYQWIYPDNANILHEDMYIAPHPAQVSLVESIFNHASLVMYPSDRLRVNFARHLHNVTAPVQIVPHCDIPIRVKQLVVAPLSDADKVINLGFIGYCTPTKGAHYFSSMAQCLHSFGDFRYQFHMYGSRCGWNFPNIIYHEYEDLDLIHQLHRDNIHIIFLLSAAEETYCYSMARAINSGLPIVFLNRGAFMNRLAPCRQPRIFCADTPDDVIKATELATRYIFEHQGARDYVEMPEVPVVNEWYKNNYPILSCADSSSTKNIVISEFDESVLPFYDPYWRDRGDVFMSCLMHVYHNKYLYEGYENIAFVGDNGATNAMTIQEFENMMKNM
jgi:hypothetical protein